MAPLGFLFWSANRPRGSGPTCFEDWCLTLDLSTIIAKKDGREDEALVRVVSWSITTDIGGDTEQVRIMFAPYRREAVRAWADLNGVPCLDCPTGGGFALMPVTDLQNLAVKMRWR